MNVTSILAFGIGVVAGLRSMTAPAAVSWAAHLGWLDLHHSPLSFMGSGITVTIVTTLAVVEYVTDLLPATPNRTTAGPLIARMLLGGLSGAAIGISAGQPLLVGTGLGAIGAIIGAFGGFEARRRLVSRLKVKDALVGILEDLVAILLAYVILSRA